MRRNVRELLQSVLGDAARALPYQHTPAPGRPHIGWYAVPDRGERGCQCRFCSAARRPVFLGPREPEALANAVRITEHHHGLIPA